MMPAAKHFDPVVGVDIHIIQPPGPVPPLPVPHPFVGFIFDAMEYIPISIPLPIPFVGVVQIPLNASVKVNGSLRAIAGTMGRTVPAVHFPIGGMFVKPPANECEMFMGSSTVNFDGDAASYMALPTLDCQCIGMPPIPRLNIKKKSKIKSLVLPTGMVLPIPMGPPVLIGGPPTISLMALAFKAAFAGAGMAIRAVAKSKVGRAAGAAFKKVRQKAFAKVKPGFIKCNIFKAEPVNAVTGEVFIDQQDFSLPGRIPLEWNRHYGSQTNRMGTCGYGWETPADARLEFEPDGSVAFYDGGTGASLFLSVPGDEPELSLVDGAVLTKAHDAFMVRTKAGLLYSFRHPPTPASELLVESITDRSGNFWRFHRRGSDLVEIEESAGRTVEVTSQKGRIEQLALRHPDLKHPQVFVRYQYDEWGNLLTVYDALEMPYRFAYMNHRLISHTNRNGLSFYYEYDTPEPRGRCIHTWGDGGLYNYHFAYLQLPDESLADLGETGVTDSLGNATVLSYDYRGLVLEEINPLGSRTKFEYDEVGRTTAVIDPAENRTEYAYDKLGNLIKLTRADGSFVGAEYDQYSLPNRITDFAGNSSALEWDARGLLRKRLTPRGGEWTFSYNPQGDLREVRDPGGSIVQLERDLIGNLVGLIEAPDRITRYRIDLTGNVTAKVDPDGNHTLYEHDAKGRLSTIRYPSGVLAVLGYDADDNLTSFRDERGHVSRIIYVGLHQVGARILSDGTRVEYRYDTEERLTAVINESGQSYRLARDPLGRIVEETDYWGNSREYRFLNHGLLTEVTDALGRKTTVTRDALGQVVQKLHDDGTVEEFAYDQLGRIVRATNELISVARTYDADGNLIEEAQGDFKVINSYDLVGNRVSRHTSKGNLVEFTYDPALNARSVLWNGTELARFRRPPHRVGIVEEQLGSQLLRSVRYNSMGELIQQHIGRDSGILIQREYSYDNSGNLVSRIDRRKGTITYAYDRDDRIVEASFPGGRSEQFGYTVAGDLLHEHTATFSATHRTGRYRDRVYECDREGNLVSRLSPSGIATFEWDVNNRLKRAINERGQTATYGYDALGRRLFKELDARRTRFFWDDDSLLADQVDGTKEREFVYRPETGEPLFSVNGRICYYDNDGAGVPQDVISGEGELLWSANYGALGNVAELLVERIENPLRLRGQYYDQETGLCYNRYRYFDSFIGAFISQDPLGVAAGDNLYAYAPNVWAWWDPLGLTCEMVNPRELYGRQLSSEFTGSQIRRLKKAMKKNGFDPSKPIQIVEIDGRKIIVDGHHRARAAGAAGIKEVPVERVQVSPATEELMAVQAAEAAERLGLDYRWDNPYAPRPAGHRGR